MSTDDNKRSNESEKKTSNDVELLKRIEEIGKATSQTSQQVTEALQDPAYLQILKARAEGKEMRVVESEKPGDDEDEDEEIDFSELDNQGLANVVVQKAVKQSVKALVENEHFRALAKNVDYLIDDAKTRYKDQGQQEIVKCREKYSDFDEYLTTMQQLSQQHPSLQLEDLYALAKVKGGKVSVNPPKPESERPTTVVPGPRASDNREVRPGRRGYAEMLRTAIEKG